MFGRDKTVHRADIDGTLLEGHLRPGSGRRWCVCGVGLSADGEALEGISSATAEAQAMIEQRFPTGWDEQRVERLLADLDSRTEEEWVASDEAAASEQDDQAVVTVPVELLPEVRRLLATHKPKSA
jgi:hypothetical protein